MKGSDASVEVNDAVILLCNVIDNPNGTTVDYKWRRAAMSQISGTIYPSYQIFFPYVVVSDAGVYICEATVSDSTNNPYVISQSGSLNITLTVTSK